MPKTHLEHLKAKYSANRDALFVEIGAPSGSIGQPIDEARRAARLIFEDAESCGQPLWLCMSGGADSEAMARTFLVEKIPFRVAILRFTNELNAHDIADAIQFCEMRQITFEIFDLDVLSFFESGTFMEIAKKYRCRSPQLTVHLELLGMVPGYPVLAWNPTSLQWMGYPGGKMRLALPSEVHFSYHRYFDLAQRPGVGFFFAYTPELFYSFFHTPTLRRMLHQQGEQAGEATTYNSKILAYQEGGFQVTARLDKFTGFERVKKHYAELYDADLSFFDQVFRKPLELLYPDPANHFSKLSSRYLPLPEPEV